MIFHSLRTRLILAFVLILLISIGMVGLTTRQAAIQQFSLYIEKEKRQATVSSEHERLAQLLSDFYFEVGSWVGVQSLINRETANTRQIILLADEKKRIVASTNLAAGFDAQIADDLLMSLAIETPSVREFLKIYPILTIDSAATTVGYLYQLDSVEAEESFVSSINRSLLIAVTVISIISLLVVVVFLYQALDPIQRLTVAAREMAAGNLSTRVIVKTKDEIGELASAYNEMASNLAENERLRRNLINDIAHELRNPLTNIQCELESIQDGLLTIDSTTIQSLHQEAISLKQLVDDLQELAIAESGKLDLSVRQVNLERLITESITSLQPRFDEKCIQFKIDHLPRPALVQVDPRRIKQVLNNLLSNAIRHTSVGGVITIGLKILDSKVLVSVQDTGEGIPLEHQPFIFDRFYRVDPSRARETGGTGLGLAISRQLIEAHGGDIWVESKPGWGTIFSFTLPI